MAQFNNPKIDARSLSGNEGNLSALLHFFTMPSIFSAGRKNAIDNELTMSPKNSMLRDGTHTDFDSFLMNPKDSQRDRTYSITVIVSASVMA